MGVINVASTSQDVLESDKLHELMINFRHPPGPPYSMLTGNFYAMHRDPPNNDFNIEYGGSGGEMDTQPFDSDMYDVPTNWQLLRHPLSEFLLATFGGRRLSMNSGVKGARKNLL